jgi:cytoskeletal protein CcmA (bactofilin family)
MDDKHSSIIGADVDFVGTVSTSCALLIKGNVVGVIVGMDSAAHITLEKGARIKGRIDTKGQVIVRGELVADAQYEVPAINTPSLVILERSARVTGDIAHGDLTAAGGQVWAGRSVPLAESGGADAQH